MANQFNDLPQIPAFAEDPNLTQWGSSHRYMQAPKQYYGRPVPDEGAMYNDSFENGMVSLQPMQRFLVDQSPFTPDMLHARYDHTVLHHSHLPVHYEPMYPSTEGFRNASPDRTSISGNSSHATQNESRSPHPYHSAPYGSPKEFSQSSLPYPNTDHFNNEPYINEVPTFGGSISLRELEYEHQEPEASIEEPEHVEMKADAVFDHDSTIKINIAANNYADSGIGNSVRDAESVQPIEVPDEQSSDSDWNPSVKRSSKRRRSSTSNNGSTRNGQKNRGHCRNNSSSLSSGNSNRVSKKSRSASGTAKANSDNNISTSGQRPFPCPLALYNCQSTFSSKNEWKRHVSTQHIKLGYWRCDLCTPSVDPNDDSTYFNDFNRKDLFTQHLRRMHTTPSHGLSRNQRESFVTEENLHEHQKRCYQVLRGMPQQSLCLFCERTFSGSNSWEERMEHVGRHLEKDRKNGVDLLNTTTWNEDKALEQYLLDEGLIIFERGQWAIGDGKRRGDSANSDEESEGES